MQLDKIEKLKNLIKSSSILNSQEREEWLQLLELMNDKQMWELEKILMSSQQSAVSSQRSLPRLDSESKRASKGEGGEVHLPSLAHIINLPQTKISQSPFPFSHLEGTKITPSPGLAIKLQGPIAVEEKTKGRFWQKIKDILAEKELPAGHKEAVEELELPDSTRPQTSPPHEEGKGEVIAKARQVSKPSMTPSISPSQGGESLKVPVPPARKSQQTFSATLKEETLLPKSKVTLTNLEEKIKLAPGIRIPQVPEGVKLKDLDTKPLSMPDELAQEILARRSKFQEGVEPKGSKIVEEKQAAFYDLSKGRMAEETSLKLGKLSDLAQLKPADFDSNSFHSLVKKIRALISSFNYHQVMSNLEKSLLYKAYINTGMQILNQKSDFMQLASKSPKEFLNREDFERFADLLIEIQTG